MEQFVSDKNLFLKCYSQHRYHVVVRKYLAPSFPWIFKYGTMF